MQWLKLSIFLFVIISCSDKPKGTTVDFYYKPYYLGKIYLEKLPVNNDPSMIVDSAEFDSKGDHLSFKIPDQEEGLFQLRIPGKALRIVFVNDGPLVKIHAVTPDAKEYRFENSGINQSLAKLNDTLAKINYHFSILNTNSDKNDPGNKNQILLADSLRKHAEFIARNFADSTSSPGAFLFAYNKVDFGIDRKGLKQFITKAAKRFSGHKAVQQLYQNTVIYIGIYEGELDIGDEMPVINLPEHSGNMYSTTALKGKYVFIDLWSTWCVTCLEFIAVKKKLSQQYPSGKLQLISVALDPETGAWKQVIFQQQIPGVHLVDEKVWIGETAKHWKFDSIPYNYLISPGGKIIAKAVKPDSVLQVLSKFIK